MKEIKAKIYPAEYNDCIKMNYLLFRKFNPESLIIAFGLLLVFITGIIISFLLWINNENSSQIFILIAISLFCLCFFLDFDRKIRRASKIMYKEAEMEKYPQYFIISEEGFHEIDAHQNNYSKWTDFKKYIFSKNYIILLNGETVVYFLSNNYSLEDFQLINEWIEKKIKE